MESVLRASLGAKWGEEERFPVGAFVEAIEVVLGVKEGSGHDVYNYFLLNENGRCSLGPSPHLKEAMAVCSSFFFIVNS